MLAGVNYCCVNYITPPLVLTSSDPRWLTPDIIMAAAVGLPPVWLAKQGAKLSNASDARNVHMFSAGEKNTIQAHGM